MIGELGSVPVSVGGINVNPNIHNTVIKNGVIAEYITQHEWLGSRISVRGGAAETDLFGSKLYMNNYTEIFADVGLFDDGSLPIYKRLRPGVTVTLGKGFNAVSFGLGYSF